MIPAPDFNFPLGYLLETFFVGLAILLLIVVAYGDARTRRIPNTLVLAIAILGVARLLVIGNPITTIYTVAVAILILIVMFLLFTRNIIGGGDVKLLVATALLIGYNDVFPFLMIMAVFGAVISIVMILMRTHLPFFLGPRIGVAIAMTKPSVPYGVAIAAGAIVMLSLQHSFIG